MTEHFSARFDRGYTPHLDDLNSQFTSEQGVTFTQEIREGYVTAGIETAYFDPEAAEMLLSPGVFSAIAQSMKERND